MVPRPSHFAMNPVPVSRARGTIVPRYFATPVRLTVVGFDEFHRERLRFGFDLGNIPLTVSERV